MSTPFWQSHSLINSAHLLLTQHFSDNPNLKMGLVIAQIVNNSEEFFAKPTELERQVWLHETAFKITSKILDPSRELTNNNLDAIPKKLEGLAILETKLHVLRTALNEKQTQEQLNKLLLKAP